MGDPASAYWRISSWPLSKRKSRPLDVLAALKPVQVPTDPGDVRPFDARRRALDARLDDSLEALFELDADRVVEPSEFSLCVLDAPRKFGVLSKPAAAEPGVALELGDAVLGLSDPAI
jgi:hypothetical protein